MYGINNVITPPAPFIPPCACGSFPNRERNARRKTNKLTTITSRWFLSSPPKSHCGRAEFSVFYRRHAHFHLLGVLVARVCITFSITKDDTTARPFWVVYSSTIQTICIYRFSVSNNIRSAGWKLRDSTWQYKYITFSSFFLFRLGKAAECVIGPRRSAGGCL